MKETTLSLDHPIVFVMDYSNSNVTIPKYSEDSVTSATASCISVATIAYVDGEVTVRLTRRGPQVSAQGLVQVFDGVIATPGKNVAVVTSENQKALEIDVPDESTRIRISVNNADFPSEVLIEAAGSDSVP